MVEESYRYQVDYWALGKMFQDKYKADMYFASNCLFFPHFTNVANFDCITTFEAKSFEVVCLFT